jgi:hypothetical protein
VKRLELRFAEMVPGWAVKDLVLQAAAEVAPAACSAELQHYLLTS